MSKVINTDFLESELKNSAFFGTKSKDQTPPTPAEPKQVKKPTVKEQTPAVNQPVNSPVNPPINQSVNSSGMDRSPVKGKPTGFYISEKQHLDLDIAVAEVSKRVGGRILFKVDRSMLLRLILESADLTSAETINKLSTQLINRSINQLTD